MKTLVVGLGNPILGDDGVGWKVAEEVKKRLTSARLGPSSPSERGNRGEIDIEFLSLGGISLMEHLIGYERAILIDAVVTDQETGSVIVSKLSEIPDFSSLHTTSAHDTSLQDALRLGRTMGANLPEDVVVVGIVTDHIFEFGEELSPPIAQAVPQATQIIIDLLA